MTADDGGREPDQRLAEKLLAAIDGEVTLIAADGTIQSSTAPSKNALGYEPVFWRDRSIWELAHPDDAGRAAQRMAEVLANPGRSVTDRFRAKHADGSWELVSMTGVNLLDDPEINAIVLSTRSITEDVQAAKALADTRDEAVRQARMKSDFVAQVSHELRSPLHGILGMAELLGSSGLDPDARRMAHAIHAEASRLRGVIDDILDISKMESGRLELNPAPFTIRTMLDQVGVVVRPLLNPGVVLIVEIADDVPDRVCADRDRINQILLNLVSNAAKFTSEGSVTITVRLPAPDRLRVEVIDTGRGIAAEDQLELFEPFVQVGPTASKQGGTGLGLAISRELVELMDGKIGVESQLARGSTFWLDIAAPATGEAATDETAIGPMAIDETADVESAIDGRDATVLVVDDNPVNQLVATHQLARLGYTARTVSSGFEALDLLEQGGIDAVLMDWHMPEIDGLETTRRIRIAEGGRPGTRVPIIAMTASAMSGDRERCLDAGMDDFLSKPATIEQIGTTLERWASNSEPTEDLPDANGDLTDAEKAVGGTQRLDVETSVLEELADEIGGDDVVRSVVQTYLETLSDRGHAITEAVQTGDDRAARRAAHALRSPSAMLGASGLSKLCHAIEKGTAPGSVDETIASLKHAVERTSTELEHWVSKRSTS